MILERVKTFVKKHNLDAEIIEHKQSGLTSENAAKAIGMPMKNIIKTLLFAGKRRQFSVVICLGSDRVDSKKLSEISGLKKPRLANPSELKEILGTKPGETPPICLLREIPVFIDKKAVEQQFVVGSAGSEFVGLKINPSDIVKFSNAKIVDITEG